MKTVVHWKITFPAIYASFVQNGFVVRHTIKCGSSVPMDQALEKEYNKPAKGQGCIIGISRRKEAVAQWNIIKHEKAKFIKYLRELCCLNEDECCRCLALSGCDTTSRFGTKKLALQATEEAGQEQLQSFGMT